jgi:hypothetical protein
MTSNSSKKGGRDDDQKGGQENFNDLQMQKFLLISTENPKELRWREEAGIPGLLSPLSLILSLWPEQGMYRRLPGNRRCYTCQGL